MHQHPSCRKTQHQTALLPPLRQRLLLLGALLLLALASLSPTLARETSPLTTAAPQYAPVVTNAVPIDPQTGHYSPNTYIDWRGSELWFVRPPYESPLVPNGDGTFTFTQGWLAGRMLYFTPNEIGGTSVLLLADDGSWQEFARSGEIYTDLAPELRGTLAGILEQTIANNPHVPGVVMYVHIPGQGMWAGARGVANHELGIPVVPLDRFRVASVSKTFVATVILQMVDEGMLSLDDTVERWMPGLVPNGEYITIRHLLNHTSGLYNYLEGPFVNAFMRDPARFWSQQEIVTYAMQSPPYFAPGEPGRWRYSNTNYVLLGMVVEHATGTSLGQQVRWRIIEPLGLHNTSFEPYEVAPYGIARGYLNRQDLSDINMSIVWSAGGVVSTAEDLGRFADALYRGGLLSPDALTEMHSFVGVDGSWGARHLVYGLGMMQDRMSIGPGLDGQPRPEAQAIVRGHTGALTGYRSAMWYLPENGVTIVVFVNQMSYDPNTVVTAAMDAILAHNDRLYP